MANGFDGRPMPAGLSLVGQRVLMEVRSSWMRKYPDFASVQNSVVKSASHPSLSNASRYPSWDTQIANISTQELHSNFDTIYVNRDQNLNPKTSNNFTRIDELFHAQRPVLSNPPQSTQVFNRSHEEKNETQQENKKSCSTQNSIMLFDDDDDSENQMPKIITEYNHESGIFHEDKYYEDEDMFASAGCEMTSPPIELETEPNSPPFHFQPVVRTSERNSDEVKCNTQQTFQFKVPQKPIETRDRRSDEYHSLSRQLFTAETKQNDEVCTAESMFLLPMSRSCGMVQEFDSRRDQRFQRDSRDTFFWNSNASIHGLSIANEKADLTLADRAWKNEDNVNEESFSWEPIIAVEAKDKADETEFNAGSDFNENVSQFIEEAVNKPSSPIANKKVDTAFISELLYKLNNLAEEIARQETEDMMNVNTTNDDNFAVTSNTDATAIEINQNKPLANFSVFKPPLKRSNCDAESKRKVQKRDCLSDCSGYVGGENSKSAVVNLIDGLDNVTLCKDKENLPVGDSCFVQNKKETRVCDRKIPEMFLKRQNVSILKNAAEGINKKVVGLPGESVHTSMITNLTEVNLPEMETQLSECLLEEVTLTIMYKEGVSQLNAAPGAVLVPRGLLLGLRYASASPSASPSASETRFYFLRDLQMQWIPADTITRFLSLLFSRPCPVVCVDAQAIFMYLVDKFAFTQREVYSEDWMFVDPLVGGWLLDPDHPPSDFRHLVDTSLGTQDPIAGGSTEERACRLLTRLSDVAAAVGGKLRQHRLLPVFTQMEMKLVPLLAVMELRGIAVDTEKLRQMQTLLERRLSAVSAQAYVAAGRKFALNSAPQLRALLYEELRLDAGLRIKSTAALGAKSTAEPMLLLLAPLHPLPALVLRHRQLHKIKATYVDAMLQHSNNGTIHTSWEQTGCATGRISSNSPNMQNIPRSPVTVSSDQELLETSEAGDSGSIHLRSAFVARAGFALVSADFCQIELRLFAHFAQDETLLHAFKQQGDIFAHLASLWLGTGAGAGDQEQRERREKTKRVVYAVMYGAGTGKLSEFLHVSNQQASAIVDSFLGLVPALRSFPQRVLERCRQRGSLRSLSGRMRWFPDIASTSVGKRRHAERQAVNFLIQGSAADVCKAAMLSTERCLRGNEDIGGRLLLQIHDELVWEVPRCNVQRLKALVSDVMQDTDAVCGEMGPLSVSLPVNVRAGYSWADVS